MLQRFKGVLVSDFYTAYDALDSLSGIAAGRGPCYCCGTTELLTCEYRGINFLKVLRGDTRGDYGFGPKRGISLRLRPQRLGAGESETRAGVRQSEGNPCSKENGGPRVMDLNKLLPIMLEKLGRSAGGFRGRTELAPDLWPVRIDSTELEVMLKIIIHNLRKKARTKAAILSVRNLRLDKPKPPTVLKGRYVAVSFSDGGRRVEPREGDVEADAYLDQVDALAKEFGGAATITRASTGRNTRKTIVTIYIPQYSPKLDARANLPPGRLRPINGQQSGFEANNCVLSDPIAV